jgi:hypothetical protein
MNMKKKTFWIVIVAAIMTPAAAFAGHCEEAQASFEHISGIKKLLVKVRAGKTSKDDDLTASCDQIKALGGLLPDDRSNMQGGIHELCENSKRHVQCSKVKEFAAYILTLQREANEACEPIYEGVDPANEADVNRKRVWDKVDRALLNYHRHMIEGGSILYHETCKGAKYSLPPLSELEHSDSTDDARAFGGANASRLEDLVPVSPAELRDGTAGGANI